VKANEASCEGEYAANESREAGKQIAVSTEGQHSLPHRALSWRERSSSHHPKRVMLQRRF